MQHLRRAVGMPATRDADQIAHAKRVKRRRLGLRSLALLFALSLLSTVLLVPQDHAIPVAFAGEPAHPIHGRLAIANAQAVTPRLTLGPTKLASGLVGTPYNQAFSTIGGVAPYTFAIAAGQLAPGLALSADGVLSGTPAAAGAYSLAIAATDVQSNTVSQSYELSIISPIAVSPPALPDGKVGSLYRQRFGASGGTAPYTFTVTLGALPPGLALNQAGLFSGRPAASGEYDFTVAATDTLGLAGSETYHVSIAPALVIGPAVLPRGQAGVDYSQRFGASGGTAPYTFSLLSGALPPGFTLSPGGTIGGTPTDPSSYDFTVGVTDALGASGQQSYSVAIGDAQLATGSHNLPNSSIGAAYSHSLNPAGATAPYTFTLIAGLLPPGLQLSSAGRIEGTPSAEGFYSFEVAVIDALGRAGNDAYGIVVAAAPLSLSPDSLPDGQQGASYRRRLSASGGRAPYSFVAQGNLPPGMELRGNGQLSGMPTAAGSFFFGVGVTDREGRIGGRLYSLTIDRALRFYPLQLGAAQVGTAYQQALNIAGGVAPYTYAVTEGALPPGLSLGAGGLLSGRPIVPGTYSFTIGATDARDTISSQSYSLRVLSPIAISPPALVSGRVGGAYEQRLAASGGLAPYSFAMAEGALPPGLALSADGVLSGTLTADGRYDFTVATFDARGIAGSRAYSLEVDQAIDISPARLEQGVVNQQYNASLLASGGNAPYTFGVAEGALPPGLALGSDGAIGGMPTATGIFTATIGVTDTLQLVGRRQYVVSIAEPPAVVAPAALPNLQAGASDQP